jgi:hypothetical protein
MKLPAPTRGRAIPKPSGHPRCQVCKHVQRGEIEAAMARGMPLRLYGVTSPAFLSVVALRGTSGRAARRRAVLTFKVSLLWISLRRGLLSPTPNIFARPHRGKPPSNLSPSDIAARSPYNNFTSTRGGRDGLDHTEDRRSMRRNGSDELRIGRTLTRAARSKYEPRLERVRGFFSAT